MSIKKSLRIMLIIFSVLPLVIGSIFTYSYSTEKMLSIQKQNLLQVADNCGNSLNSLIEAQKAEVSLLVSQRSISSLLQTNSTDYNNYISYYDIVRDLLNDRRSLYTSCDRITIYNKDHEIIVCSDKDFKATHQPYKVMQYKMEAYSSTCQIVEIPMSFDSSNSRYSIEVGMAVLNKTNTDIIGYIVTTLDLSFYQDYFKSLDENSYGMIVNNSGKIINHSDAHLVGKNINSKNLRTEAIAHANITTMESGFLSNSLTKSNYIYTYSTIPDLDWAIIVAQNVSSINEFATFNLFIITITTIAISLLAFFTSSLFSKIYTKPILNLRDTMRAASDGNLDVQCHITSKNEIGELSKNFNRMLHIIKTNYDDLTSMHELLIANEEELRSNYNHIEYLAYHDVLTSLPNKLAFYDKVDSALSAEPGISKRHAIFFVDLDNFKTINDTLGHDYGDALLTQTAEKLNSLIDTEDILARAGGDEFLLFKYGVSDDEEAIHFASAIIEAFQSPFKLNGEVVYVSMSIGISIYPKNGLTHNILVKNADIAMYKSKDTGKNKSTLFDKTMEDELNRNTEIVEVLRHAVESKEVYLMYQPQIDTTTKNIIGYEALMRINSEKLGLLSPSEFIPIAEESGLITSLGTWALEEACSFNQSLIEKGYPARTISVNISSIQLNQSGFIQTLEEILERTGLKPEYLELEITESTLLSSFVDATELVKKFQSIGVHISLDDFGTGYSSLNYLTNLPINTLKIDKSFIDNICSNGRDIVVAESIITLAHQLHIKVVAEGVENETQFTLLESKGCDCIQGYVFSRPLLPEFLIALLDYRS